MINLPSAYTEAGAKAAEARNQRDEARAQFHADWFRKARALENDADRVTANRLYDEAYKANRNAPKVEYFR